MLRGLLAMQRGEAQARSRLWPRGLPCMSWRMSGTALPGILIIAVLLLLATTLWFEITVTEIRRTANVANRTVAFHAADAALEACVQLLLEGRASVLPADYRHEPQRWRQPGIFDGGAAVTPFPLWLNAAQPPRCVIEAWWLPQRSDARAYLLTARGVGVTPDVVVWLQSQILLERGMTTQRWRRVVAEPEEVMPRRRE